MPSLFASEHPAIALLALFVLTSSPAMAQDEITFTAEQVAAGSSTYRELCQTCHVPSLSDGQFGTPLRGSYFRNNWAGRSLGELMQYVYEKMPPESPQTLSGEQIATLLSWILSRNSLSAGETAMSGDINGQNSVMLPW